MYLNRGSISLRRISNLHPDIESFVNRIRANGGSISFADITAIDTFVQTVYRNNLRSLFLAFYPYAGNDWNAARESLWFPLGKPSQLALVGTNFVSTDYTRTTGFKANGGGKGFNTGFGITGTNWSYSVYLREGGNNSSQIGTGSSISDYLAQNFSSNQTYYSNSGAVADTTVNGYYTAQYQNLFRNATQLSTATGIAASGQNIYIHGRNNNGSLNQPTARSIGCAAIGLIKTQEQEQIIYNAIQSLMTAFGRAI